MGMLKSRIDATNKKIEEFKAARKLEAKSRRADIKRTRADRERQKILVGEAVLARLANGELDEIEFRKMMSDSLSRPADRALFDLDEE